MHMLRSTSLHISVDEWTYAGTPTCAHTPTHLHMHAHARTRTHTHQGQQHSEQSKRTETSRRACAHNACSVCIAHRLQCSKSCGSWTALHALAWRQQGCSAAQTAAKSPPASCINAGHDNALVQRTDAGPSCILVQATMTHRRRPHLH